MMKRKLAGLLAALLLVSCAGADAFAAGKSFKDLPASHWAYKEITRAVSYGIMNGLGDGRMNPDGTLTWAHYLSMLSRTFAPMAYEGARSSGTDWRNAGYQVALDRGYLCFNDFLTVTPSTLNAPISRQDVAVLLSRTLPGERLNASADNDGSGDSFSVAGNASGSSGSGNGSNIQIMADDDGGLWIVKDGVSIALSQALYDVYAHDDGETTASSGSSGGYDTPIIAPAPVTVSDPPLSDFAQMDANHQAAVRRLYELEIVRGKSDGSFGPADTVRRSDGAVLLMRTLDANDNLRSGETLSLTLDLTDGDGKAVADTVKGVGKIGQSLSSLASVYAPTGYKVAPQDGKVSVISKRYALLFAPLTQAEQEEIEANEQLRQGLITQEEYDAKDFWLKKLGDNARKRLLIYGAEYTETIEVPITPETDGGAENPEGVTPADGGETAQPLTRLETVTRTEIRYDSDEEARSHMTAVEVPVWTLRGNSKTPGTLNLTVNAALAEEVKAIFTEIYNDPEQFPISDVGGYSWRNNNSRSEHKQGTAIDLNVDSNYQVRDGVGMVGSGWTPGEDPYSITPGGSVVRTFAEHGWDWGGNAWAGHSDQTYGYHDYMHFSYFGR